MRVVAAAAVALWAGAGAGAGGLAGAVQWVEARGQGWSTLAVYHQDTRKRYGAGGEVRDFFAQGRAATTSAFLTTTLGLGAGVDAWAQLSFHRLRYDDVAGQRASTGAGDMRFWLRAAPLRWLGSEFPFALRAGMKAPVGDFDVNAEIVPLGDGQRDWEVLAEAGHSFWPRSLYVSAWAGYRWREENRESRKDFGNEFFYFLQAGGRLAGPVGAKVAVDGWNGVAGVTEGVRIPSFRRQLIQLQSSLTLDIGPGQLEAGVRRALRGRNLPAGTTFLAQYFTRLNVF